MTSLTRGASSPQRFVCRERGRDTPWVRSVVVGVRSIPLEFAEDPMALDHLPVDLQR
jgi:hypothetical protein